MTAWRVRPEVSLLEATWDDETVVYNCGSAHTHVFNRPVLAMVHRLQGGWAEMPEILSIYQSAVGDPDLANVVEPDMLLSVLRELEHMGMVEARAA